jgi:hypothetical protein
MHEGKSDTTNDPGTGSDPATPGPDQAATMTTPGSATEMMVDGTTVDTREVQRLLLRLGGNGF